MIAFWIAVVVGVAVAGAYITLGVQAFGRVRRAVLADAAAGERAGLPLNPDDALPEGGFTWKAIGAVIFSTIVIILLGVDPVFWYLPPILAVGAAVAVITAFLVERRTQNENS
ncbi:hypothetical protein MJO55_17640 [Mycolicibacterium rufum]|uniref:Uncharacterized protein n=1 Tax=Mycolicibacterium rufum TaxID=318424 RepID=A0A9X3BJU7_9MYCO|nr:hypothetical protein [Mycolicibacterium rufum]KGI68952.1 membrane protein [Mycolicibacterium rufum]MCV7073329.1 hypothetical protein [Mycolicibacterium rufum]ULP35120.1 hypothetical protein MJO55_17640 [Mycolicibacterium rufum]